MKYSYEAGERTDCFVHQAESALDDGLLQRVARTLDELRHPGLVELVAAGPGPAGAWELRTRWVGPAVGQDQVHLSSAHVAGIGAAVATTLADLHSLGWSHGTVTADHILLDRDGRPILCGLSGAGRLLDRSAAEADTSSLTCVLEGLAARSGCGQDRSLGRALRGRFRSSQAVVLARRLADPRLAPALPAGLEVLSPGSSLPPAPVAEFAPVVLSEEDRESPAGATAPYEAGPGSTESPTQVTGGAGSLGARAAGATVAEAGVSRPVADRSPGWREIVARARGSRRLAAGVVMVGLLAGALAVGPAVVGSRSAPACPAVDQGCRPVPTAGGVLVTPTGHYRVGAPGDVVVLGRWACGPVALPALLHPVSGAVWIFDRWPTPTADVAARSLGRVPGARSLAVVAGRDGCDTLEAERAGAPPVAVTVGVPG